MTDKIDSGHQLYEYIEYSLGWFWLTDIYKDLNVTDDKDKANIRVKLSNYCKEGILERDPDRNGRYRRIDSRPPAMMKFNADSKKSVEMYLPFHLEDFFTIYPGNVFIVAGVSNFGKTDMMLMTAFLNQHRDSIYFNTDAEEEEIQARIEEYQPHDAWRTKFPRKVKSEEIANMIERHYKDEIVFVDYLKVVGEFYMISRLIEDVGQAVGKGIAVISLQMNPGAEQGRGGAQTMDLSRLYVKLDKGPDDTDRSNGRTYKTTEMKITKMKMLKNAQYYDPNGWKFIYRMVHIPGQMPTYKMLYEPPGYVEFNGRQKLAAIRQQPQESIEVNPIKDKMLF